MKNNIDQCVTLDGFQPLSIKIEKYTFHLTKGLCAPQDFPYGSLSNDAEDHAYNINLLNSPRWIDIPTLFNDKQHALNYL